MDLGAGPEILAALLDPVTCVFHVCSHHGSYSMEEQRRLRKGMAEPGLG